MFQNDKTEPESGGRKDDRRQKRLDNTTRRFALGLGLFFGLLMIFTAYMAARVQYPAAVGEAAEKTLQASQKLVNMAQDTIRTYPNGEAKLLEAITSTLAHIKEVQKVINDTLSVLDDTFWDELFKTGFLLIGGSLTSAVGYYFGNQGIDSARRSAEQAQEMTEVAKREAKRAEEQEAKALKLAEELEQVTDQLAPTDEETVEGILAVEIKDD